MPEAQSLPTVSEDMQKLRSDVFAILRRPDVTEEQCFAEVAMVTFAALSPTVSGKLVGYLVRPPGNFSFKPLTRVEKDAGWTETPLFSAPLSP
jgi:hypothetical protein